jgi:acyl carrier protein
MEDSLVTVYKRVSAILVECLGVEEVAIRPESHLETDLGAESIDLLDILFRLEE